MQEARTISVQQGYELWASTYATERNPLLTLQERTLSPLLPELRDLRVIDIGCGTGRWLRRMALHHPAALLGIDPSEAMLLNACRGRPAYIVCADACAIPVVDQWAEFILCSLALDHIEDLHAFAREVSRVAADGARLLLSEFHPDAHVRGWRRSFRHAGETFQFDVSARPLGAVCDAFALVGFSLELCEEPSFGEPERKAFEELGRGDLYDSVLNAGPALFHLMLCRRPREITPMAPPAVPLRLENARIATSARETICASVAVAGDNIFVPGANSTASQAVDLSGHLVLPGLVNAHDHLEFALFPRLGKGSYTNAQRWAEDIHHPESLPVREQRAIPQEARLWWGGLKNLLSGVTTVHHHNPYDPLFDGDFPVRVARCGWAHSFGFETDVAKQARAAADSPFILHLGEGVDEESRAEFGRLQTTCGIHRNTVLVHGVALNQHDLAELRAAGGALIWCPSSNVFMLGQTLARETACEFDRLALATDSPLSGAGDMFDEIATALQFGIPAERIFEMVTSRAADVLRQNAGTLLSGGADLIVLRDPGGTPADALVTATHASLELAIVRGRVRLISPALCRDWPFALAESLEKIVIDGVERLVDAPVSRLLAAAREHLGPDIRLGHKRVWQ